MPKETRKDARVDVLSLMAAPQSGPEKPEFLPDIPEFVEAFPVLNAFMTVRELEGKARQTPTLTIWVEDWGVKIVLADRQNKRKLFLTAASLGLLWADLNEMLTDPNARWMAEDGTRRKR